MGNYISGMRVALRVVLVAAAAIGCFGAEVFSLDGEGVAPAPAPAGGGGSATFQPLTDEIARAKAAEAALDTKIDGRDAAGLLGKITAAETMIAAETTAKDKLATDTAAAQKAMEDSLKKATDDAATKETASASALAGMKKTVDAETTNRQDGDSRVRRELEAKIKQSAQNLAAFETKVNENRAGETKSLESRDGKMVSTVKALGDKLSQEATASNTVITQQASELKALTAKVLQMETKVAGLTAGKKPASTPPAL